MATTQATDQPNGFNLSTSFMNVIMTAVQVPRASRAVTQESLSDGVSDPLLAHHRRVVEIEGRDGPEGSPQANKTNNDNADNEDPPLPIWLGILLLLVSIICLTGPVCAGAAVAWTDADPFGLAFLAALFPFMVFGCVLAWAFTVWKPASFIVNLIYS